MAITGKGAAFVARMDVVDRMARGGTPVFAALASGLEDEDWMLVYVAARKLAADVRSQGEASATFS